MSRGLVTAGPQSASVLTSCIGPAARCSVGRIGSPAITSVLWLPPLRHLAAKCLHPPRPYYSVSFFSPPRSVTRPRPPPPHSFVLIASVMLWKCPGQRLCGKLPRIEPLQGSVYCITGGGGCGGAGVRGG